MPKKFPDPPDHNAIDVGIAHPVAAVSPTPPPTVEPSLADLLFGGADEATIAEHLRSVRDEWSANPLAELLCNVRDWLPAFRRAEQDGTNVAYDLLCLDELRRLLEGRLDSLSPESFAARQRVLDDADNERRRLNELSTCFAYAEGALIDVGRLAPALLKDPRSQTIGETVTSDVLLQRRMFINQFASERKLELSVGSDGWPRSESRRNAARGTVRLVSVVPPLNRFPQQARIER